MKLSLDHLADVFYTPEKKKPKMATILRFEFLPSL